MKTNKLYGKCESKNGFLSLAAKANVAEKIGIIAATNRLKIYEVVEMGTRAKFPEYFENESTVKMLNEHG